MTEVITFNMDPADELVSVVRDLGLEANVVRQAGTSENLSVRVDGRDIETTVVLRSHPTPAELERLTAEAAAPGLLIANRISDAGREVLRVHGWSWLDRRGHVRVWREGLRIESSLQLGSTSATRGRSEGNLWTTVGLEIAQYALVHSKSPLSARTIARELGRSVAGVHQQLERFIDSGLIGPTTRLPLLPDLFWETAANWPDDGWIPLSISIDEAVDLVRGGRPVRVDDYAAALAGAPIPGTAQQAPRFYVYGDGNLRRLARHGAGDGPTRCYVRANPTTWLMENVEVEKQRTDEDRWTIGDPILCAFRLAAEGSRGREIVEAWGIVPTGIDDADA